MIENKMRRLADAIVRPMQAGDLEELVRVTGATGFFRPEEVTVAGEVLRDCAAGGEGSGYLTLVAASDRRLLGYVCFGPTPLTRGTWDIYWIAVAPESQHQGIGRGLMAQAEDEIRRRGGRLVLVETSTQEMYESTRRFYRSLGYVEASCIPDFYDVGDGRLTFSKTLSAGGIGAM